MKTKIAITLGAMALSAMSGAAYAGSITQPGETAGLALGAPLPEGVYFENTGSYGRPAIWVTTAGLACIPALPGRRRGNSSAAVSRPMQRRLEEAGITHLPPVKRGDCCKPWLFLSAIYNPALLVGEAWKLDSWGLPGWNFSSWYGGYAPVDNALGQDFWVFNSRTAITYNADNWDLTAHVIYGITATILLAG